MDTAEKVRLQKHVGIVVVGASTLFAIANAVTLFAALHRRLGAVVENPIVYLLFLMGLLALPSLFLSSELIRLSQSLLLLAVGVVVLVSRMPTSFWGIPIYVYGLFLALRYGYFDRRAPLKFAVAAAALLGASATAPSPDGFSATSALESTMAAGCLLYMLWISFSTEIERYRHESERLRLEALRNEVFVTFGRHIAGMVHNIKSKLMAIEGFNDLLAETPAGRDGEGGDYAALQRLGIEQLHGMLDSLVFAVRSYQRARPEAFSLGMIVRSAVELLRLNQGQRTSAQFRLELCTDDSVFAIPLSVIQILDGLIENASQASANDQPVVIRTEPEENFIVCRIRDHGPGLPFCARCDREACLSCPNFRIGRSTKADGSGIGVTYAQMLIREIGGGLRYASRQGEGTEVSVWFPRPGADGSLNAAAP